MKKSVVYGGLLFSVIALSTSAIFVKLAAAPSAITAFYRLFFALLAIKYSFLKALFIYLCIAIGVWIGRILDRKTNVREKIEGFFRND